MNNSAVSNTIYEPMCVPELGAYIDYTQAPAVLSGDDRKSVSVSSIANPPGTPAPSQPTNNNFLHEGKSLLSKSQPRIGFYDKKWISQTNKWHGMLGQENVKARLFMTSAMNELKS